MIESILSVFRASTQRRPCIAMPSRQARLEQLEHRRLLSITSVTDIAGLRAALDTFNATSDDDTINVAAGTYTLSGASLDNANASGDLDITKTGGSLTIQGAGAGSTFIDANYVDRVLHITGATTVTLADLTIQNGTSDDDGTTSGEALGGGILISGAADVTLSNVSVTANAATGTAGVANGSAGEAAYGGGIAVVNASASLTLTDTNVTSNVATGGAGQTGTAGGSWTNGGTGGQGGAAGGGALYLSGGDAVLTGTSTLSGNSATGGYGGTGGQGGYTTFAGWQGATGGTGGTATGGGAFVSGGSLSVPTSGAITGNTATGGQGGNGGSGGTSMTVGAQGNGGDGGAARGGGAYFTGGNMAAIQSGAVATNSLTAGWAGTGNLSGSNGSTSDTNAGRQASTLSVTIEQAGAQADPATSSPVEFTVTFSESVSDFATGDVTIAGTTGATTATVTGSGTTYTVVVSGMTSNGWVSAYVAAGVATNAGATPNGASASADNVVVLNADFAGPTISSTTPADNATGVAVAADLAVVFNENVAKGTGNISIYDNSDTLFEAIDVTSSKVSISGDTVTINPTNSLALGTSYYVQIAATAIEDTSGNAFAGIADKTTWNFTTPDAFTNSGIALTGVGGSSVAWGDYDNDGDLDILLTGADGTVSSMVSKIYRNDGSNTFTDIGASMPGLWSSSAVWGDYDNDGDLDALITGRDSSSNIILKLYRNDGSDTFTEIATSLPAVRLGSLSWGDYDNDGDLDLLLTGSDGSGNKHGEIYRNDGSDTFTDIGATLVGVYVSTATWGDYDNDGDLDIVLTGQDASLNRITKLYRNDGSDTFTDVGASLTDMSSAAVAWGDYDNDGDLDLLLSGLDGSANRISKIYRNDGSDTFTDIGASLTGVSESSGVWGDYDNDGDLDLLLAGYADGWVPVSAIYRNDGSDTFTNTNASIVDVHSPSLAWGDYDGDGDLDFLLTGFNSGGFETTRIYRNDSPIANTPPTAPTGLNVTAGSTPGEKTLNWNAATDKETPQDGLSYNIYIGTTSGDDNVAPAMADLSGGTSDGLRRIATIGPSQGTSWTITGLADGTYYWSVQAVDTALAGSAWATEGTFTVDTIAPAISSTTPADDATGVAIDANLVITFDENVVAGTGYVSIYDIDDNLVEAIDVTGDQVSVSGATVTVNPTDALAELTTYYVQIDATAFDDTSGNSFAGISDTTTWSFTTADETAPTISSTTPADNATDVAVATNLVITFDENVVAGTGYVSIYDSDDNLVEAIDVTGGQVTVSDATVTIDPSDLLAEGAAYYVQIDATAFEDTAGNAFAGISDTTTWSFATAAPDDLGTVDFLQRTNQDATSSPYYILQTAHAGILTVAVTNTPAGTAELALLSDSRVSLTTGEPRIDWNVEAGETYYVSLSGTATDVELTILNLVDDRTTDIVVYGTSSDDSFEFGPVEGATVETYAINVNNFDVEYQFTAAELTSVTYDGGDGADSAQLTGTDGDDHVLLSPLSATLTTDDFTVSVSNVEQIAALGGSGNDMAELADSAGDDTFVLLGGISMMSGAEYLNAASGFESVHAYSRAGGNDTATLEDTAGDDLFQAYAGYKGTATTIAKLTDSDGNLVRTKFFDSTAVSAVNGGSDEAIFYDSAGDDLFAADPEIATMTAETGVQSAAGFDEVQAYALYGGTDTAELVDSAGNDTLVSTDEFMKLFGDGFYLRAKFFEEAHGYARNGGYDRARMYGSSGDDTFKSTTEWSKMIGTSSTQRVKFFRSVKAFGNGGTDRAFLYDSPGNDNLDASGNTASITGPVVRNQATDFDWVRAVSENGGTDTDRTEAVDFTLRITGNWI